ARKKELEKLTINDIKVSSRKYPYINFKYDREIGNDILFVENLTKEGYFSNVSFTVGRDDKIGIVGKNSRAITMLYDILMGNEQATSGYFKWGKTITPTYLPQNNDSYFVGCDLSLVDWLSRFSYDHYEEFVRGWLGRMLFSGEEALKKASVISGGERVRCMLSKMMLEAGNFMILDEPTNHLDLESITSLNDGLTAFKGCMLLTSHDRELMNTVANRIIEIEDTKVYDRPVIYDEYLEETVLKGEK
ncbi:MAG: ABC-F family ATP-binding cassette domain-containing protein, partial [Clostridia bacterium]|nr:ABC-F family ATP-binding cassette domain-containing protein [Clostridia bacterium]